MNEIYPQLTVLDNKRFRRSYYPSIIMNHEERFLSVLNGEIPDRVPYTEIGGMDSVIIGRHYGYDYGKPSKAMDLLKFIPGWRKLFLKLAENAKIVSSIANRGFELYRLMKQDAIPIVMCMFPIIPANHAKKIDGKPYQKFAVPESGTFVDEFGRIMKTVPTAYETSMLYYMDGALKTEEIYDQWGTPDPHHPVRIEVYNMAREYYDAQKAKGIDNPYPLPAIGGINEVTWEGMSFKSFAKALRRNRPFITRVLDDRTNFAVGIIDDLAKAPVPPKTFLFYDDYGFKNGPLLPPKDFIELFAPRLKKIVDTGHKHGMKVIMHSCGNLNQLWDDLVGTGIDALHPIEPTAKMDIFALKKANPNLTFIGNVSPQDLQDKDPDFIREYTKRLMTECKEGGRFILSSGHSINPAVDLQNYLAMRETHEKYAKY